MPFTRTQIIGMLNLRGADKEALLADAHKVREENAGKGIYLRGLIEYSNRCRKSCLYCGIRNGMESLKRYTLPEEDVVAAAAYAIKEGYGSVVIQGGETITEEHIAAVERIVRRISLMTPVSAGADLLKSTGWEQSPGITLSLGEQEPETYRRWFNAGATRYLLRIESSDPALFNRIHPDNPLHSYEKRIKALYDLREAGFQLGTGVMIGLPGQTVEQLADDLMFIAGMDADMCGMGPYVESLGTPMAGMDIQPSGWRVDMTLKMIAVLRLMMPDINIAAATALDALHPQGRLKALYSGANVLMPNLTPDFVRRSYNLYDGKLFATDFQLSGIEIRRGLKGDPQHFEKKLKNIR